MQTYNDWIWKLRMRLGWSEGADGGERWTDGLACGRDYELMLLRGDRVLSCTAGGTGRLGSLSPRAELDASAALRVSAFLREPTHELAALTLPNEQRTLVVLPATGDVGGEGVGILPLGDPSTVADVLDRAFGDRVLWLSERGETRGAREDVDGDALERLLRNVLLLLDHHMGAAHELAVRDRCQMSHYMCAQGELLRVLLSGQRPSGSLRPFPIAYPFHGSFCPSRAAWMALCFAVGLMRALPPSRYPIALAADHERLLPMLEITAGNRTRLPEEWQECARMAERLGMFFDVRRTRSSILVRVCPLVPASEREFAIRAPQTYGSWESPPEKSRFCLDKTGAVWYTVDVGG